MIFAYSADSGRRVAGGPEVLADAPPLWIDLLDPTPEEERAVEALIGIDVPTREEMQEIEVSSRLTRQADALVMTAPVLTDSSGFHPRNAAITFILTGDRLVTVRYATPQALASYVERIERGQIRPVSNRELLLELVEAIVDRMADVLERIGTELDGISQRIFHQPAPARTRRRSSSREMEALLRTIGRNGDLSSKVHDTIQGLRRMTGFLPAGYGVALADNGHTRLETIGSDLHSLAEYADFVQSKITFLLDATLGMINIQQNHIIKLFSVMAVLFLPPTLVASIYGMNFHDMPELSRPWGYPMALVIMVLAAVLPFWFFKRKGWL